MLPFRKPRPCKCIGYTDKPDVSRGLTNDRSILESTHSPKELDRPVIPLPCAFPAMFDSFIPDRGLHFFGLLYLIYMGLSLTFWVRPRLRKTAGGWTHEKELPYLIIPALILSFLWLLSEVGHYYFWGSGLFKKTGTVTGVGNALLFSFGGVVLSTFYTVILPKVFYISHSTRSLVKPLSPLKTAMLILPAVIITPFFFWLIPSVLFLPEELVTFEMELSFAWISIPIYLVILELLNRVWLIPYLLRTKGRVSRDDQLPYFVIPTLIMVFLVLGIDIARYNLGSIQIEQMRFSILLFMYSLGVLAWLGFLLPRVYFFSFQESVFIKPEQLHLGNLTFLILPWILLIALTLVFLVLDFFDAYLAQFFA